MKKPEEIKKSLRIHSLPHPNGCIGCAYRDPNKISFKCQSKLFKDVREYIQHLESMLNQAVEDIRMLGRMGQNVCPVCAHYNHGEGSKEHCITCIINRETDNFEWRGMKEEDK